MISKINLSSCAIFLFIGISSLFFSAGCTGETSATSTAETELDSMIIDQVWSGHPVGFALLTEAPHQFVAYYESSRAMIVKHRQLGSDQWDKKVLSETIGWDSHNYISMALDSKGHLHVSGNMHVDPLVYFQATQAYDIQSLERRESLIGDLEDRTTYPKFFSDPEGDLIFTYRDGGSGNGNQIYNRYDPDSGNWSRLLDQPLMDGQGAMNAYLHGPVLGPDGYYHLIWVWRDTPDAATNHDISYARSKDLVNWEKSDGSPQPLPITLENCEIIDPVPAGGGMINGNTVIGFDRENRPVVSYHKFGPNGNTQIYNARRSESSWEIHQATNWDFRWDFGGRGSIGKRVGLTPIALENGQVTQRYWIDTVGTQKFRLDPEELTVAGPLPYDKGYPESLETVRSDFPGMEVQTRAERAEDGTLYLLRWETLGRNRDRPRTGPLPAASPLVLYTFKDTEG